jgi:hypothetical protein
MAGTKIIRERAEALQAFWSKRARGKIAGREQIPYTGIIPPAEQAPAFQERNTMPTYKKGEMFDAPGVHIVTASSFISNDGTLVMSMGAGLSLKTRYPDLPKVFGAIIREYCGHQGRYGLILHGNKGVLQTRYDMGGRMEPDVIKYGLKILYSIAEGNPAMTYHLNHPGVSLNKMSIPEIDKLLGSLPENVWIWQKA